MTDKIIGKKGKGGGGSGPPPIESPNSLQSKAIVRLVDLLGEGEIQGLVDGARSIYVNETPLQSDGAAYNFSGVTVWTKTGTPDQTHIPGLTDIAPSVTDVSTEVKYGVPVIRSVTDTDVDDIRVIITVPALQHVQDDGSILGTTVLIEIYVQPDGGTYNIAQTLTIGDGEGKCISPYQTSVRIKNLESTFGEGPWNIKVQRATADSDSAKLTNATHWTSLVEIKNRKIAYRNNALVGVEIDAEQFGSQIPRRSYDVKGLKIKVPDNRSYYSVTDEALYTGSWTGTFTTEWCDNPAWVLYDVLTNTRYGLGIDPDRVDKWALYTIGVYCDTQVDDGFGGTERRFTFNYVVQNAVEAYHLINLICSSMRVMPYWSSGLATFVQDSPKDAELLVTPANVEGGVFNYSGSSIKDRYTVANVTWNDLDDMCRQAVEVVEDHDGIDSYGYHPIDTVAYGCTSRGQAHRWGKWILDTSLNEIETVTYVAGLDHMDCVPGTIVNIVDPTMTTTNRFGGRVISATTTSITIDNAITLEAGKTYSVTMTSTDGTLIEKNLTNSVPSLDVTVVTWTGAITAPTAGSVWVITASDLAPRPFRVVSAKEVDKHKFEILAIEYDSTKYARIEDGIYLEEPAYINIPTGELSPPTNIEVEGYTYTEGALNNPNYGMLVGWTASTDPRTIYYEVQMTDGTAAYSKIGDTSGIYYDIKPVTSGTYSIRVRGVGALNKSAWLIYTDYNMITTISGLEPPTNLQIKGGGTTFSGIDCEFEWTGSAGAYYNGIDIDDGIVKDYKVEIYYPNDDTLLRTIFTADTHYNYLYGYNVIDSEKYLSSDPIRSIKVKVYTRDVYDTLSEALTNTFNNPAPDMNASIPTVTSKPTYLSVTWLALSDLDMSHYVIYCDDFSPPTTEVGVVKHPGNKFEVHGLEYGTTYYVQIEPYDEFGVGTKSSIPSGESPAQIPDINIDAELVDTITMTDSDSNNTVTLAKLYDRTFDSDGVSYTVSGTDKYVQYEYNIENYFDRVAIWTDNANGRVYLAYSLDGDSWSYLKGQADHTLGADKEFVAASNQADAVSNYWQLAAGFNTGLLPNNVTAKYIRLYLTGTYTTTIYEYVPSRILISELAALEHLSAISTDIGTINAGSLQSSDYGADDGLKIDLDNKEINLGGSSDPVLKFYNDGDNKLDITAGVTFRTGGNSPPVDEWAHSTDVTKIDGGQISAGSSITLSEGGFARFGKNVLIDTIGEHGSVIVAKDSPITLEGKLDYSEQDYAHLTDGDLTTYYYDGGTHIPYKSLSRIEVGVAQNDTEVVIPGIWKTAPKVALFPDTLQSYNITYANQSQSLSYDIINLSVKTQYGDKAQYKFTPRASLVLSAGNQGETMNTSVVKTGASYNSYTSTFDCPTSAKTLPANVRRLIVNTKSQAWSRLSGSSENYKTGAISYWCQFYYSRYNLTLWYYDGAWRSIVKYIDPGWVYNTVTDYTFDTGVRSSDITLFVVRMDHLTIGQAGSANQDYGGGSSQTIIVTSYSTNLVGATTIATGTVRWIAVGA